MKRRVSNICVAFEISCEGVFVSASVPQQNFVQVGGRVHYGSNFSVRRRYRQFNCSFEFVETLGWQKTTLLRF